MIRGSVVRRGRPTILGVTRAHEYHMPAPIRGWNVRDSVAAMDERDATILDNWFPRDTDVTVRAGYASHATGLGSAVRSLMTYGGRTSSKMFAAAGSSVYNVTGSGAVGAAEFGSLSGVRFQHVNFGTSAGAFLYIVNGADAPRYYDGTSWTTPTITGAGLTASNLVNVAVFKRRLLFAENNKLGFWYFPVETVAGSITYFDLAPLCQLGGYLMAMGSWTRDGGAGLDDLAVFVTSMGEVIIYQGTDPGDATAWSLVGVFRIGAPIGRRCLAKLGPDLVIITVDGFAPVGRFLPSGRIDTRAAVSDRIRGAVKNAVIDSASLHGWQPIVYPRGGMVIFNIPITDAVEYHQYVSNSTTGAWCRFKNQNGICWELLDDFLYFGAVDGKVYKADTGFDDNGADITSDGQTAFSYFDKRGTLKHMKMARPLLVTDGDPVIAFEANTDFGTRIPTRTPEFSEGAHTEWDLGTWDVDPWSDSEVVIKNWQTVAGVGYAAAVRMRTVINGGNLRWLATDFIYETGGLL